VQGLRYPGARTRRVGARSPPSRRSKVAHLKSCSRMQGNLDVRNQACYMRIHTKGSGVLLWCLERRKKLQAKGRSLECQIQGKGFYDLWYVVCGLWF
jgi:hypothetical protein